MRNINFSPYFHRAIDIADEFPRAEVIAVDLAPIQPEYVKLPIDVPSANLYSLHIGTYPLIARMHGIISGDLHILFLTQIIDLSSVTLTNGLYPIQTLTLILYTLAPSTLVYVYLLSLDLFSYSGLDSQLSSTFTRIGSSPTSRWFDSSRGTYFKSMSITARLTFPNDGLDRSLENLSCMSRTTRDRYHYSRSSSRIVSSYCSL